MVWKVQARVFRCAPADFDWAGMLAQLAGLDQADRYLERGMGKRFLGVPFPKYDGLGLWTLRPGAQIDLHDAGEIRPWDLPSDVAEGSYFRCFDDGIVVTAAKGHGPRPSGLAIYLDGVCNLDVDFDPVIRVNTGDYVASLDDARSVVLSVDTTAGLQVLRAADRTLGDSVASMMGATDGTRITVEIGGRDADEKAQMWHKTRDMIRRLADRADLENMRKVRVMVPGEVAGTEEVDLLKDRLSYQIGVDAGGLQQSNAFVVLQSAYDRFRGEYGDN